MDAPRDNLVRAVIPGPEFRADTDTGLGVLEGHFCVFNEWTRIRSWYEGDFYERIAPGAAKRTIDAHWNATGGRVKCLFDHGHDPQIGNKVLGPFEDLSEDDTGVYYAVPLLDTSYNRDLQPGIAAGVYGASFRFRVIEETWNEEPGKSAHNPEGRPERTIKQFQLYEGGPVTFPAYASATAGMRSMTDEWLARSLTPSQLDALRAERTGTSLAVPAAGTTAGESATPTTDDPPSRHSIRFLDPAERVREIDIITTIEREHAR